MAKKKVAPVYGVETAGEHEVRWQCAGCQGFLGFSLPLSILTVNQLLVVFNKAHLHCPPLGPVIAPVAADGPTAKAQARRNLLLALTREHTSAEKRELNRLEVQLTLAGVLAVSNAF